MLSEPVGKLIEQSAAHALVGSAKAQIPSTKTANRIFDKIFPNELSRHFVGRMTAAPRVPSFAKNFTTKCPSFERRRQLAHRRQKKSIQENFAAKLARRGQNDRAGFQPNREFVDRFSSKGRQKTSLIAKKCLF